MGKSFKDSFPQELVTHISAICGDRGEKWFESLPQIIKLLERRWNVSVAEPFPGIEFNFVAPAKRESGEDVVVKIAPPFERVEIFCEGKYLRSRDGSGAAKLLAEVRELRSILIERALPGKALFKHFEKDPAGCVRPAIEVMHSILRAPPTDMTDVQTLDSWFNNFRRYKSTNFPKDYAEKAFEIYERLSVQPGRSFYLHGDFHPGNIVTSHRTPFLAIDPKGVVGHIGYDIAVFLNNLSWWQKEQSGAHDLLQSTIGQFSAAFNMNEREIREWAFAYMVIGQWWNFDDMPEHYKDEFALLDIWKV
jgi:streptomycin 6-kinase